MRGISDALPFLGEVLHWIGDNALALSTVALAVVTVAVTWWTTHHDTRERQRDRKYARILQVQAALRSSISLAAEWEARRGWRSRVTPTAVAVLVGLAVIGRRAEIGKAAEVFTLLTGVGGRFAEDAKPYAYLQAAYDTAGLLGGELGPSISPEIVERLRVAALASITGSTTWRWKSSTALQTYIGAATAVHAELDRIIREEQLEPRPGGVGR